MFLAKSKFRIYSDVVELHGMLSDGMGCEQMGLRNLAEVNLGGMYSDVMELQVGVVKSSGVGFCHV